MTPETMAALRWWWRHEVPVGSKAGIGLEDPNTLWSSRLPSLHQSNKDKTEGNTCSHFNCCSENVQL